MLNDFLFTSYEFDTVPNRLQRVTRHNVDFFRLKTKPYNFRGAAELSDLHGFRFCSFLNAEQAPVISSSLLNRAARRWPRKLQTMGGNYVLMIDASLKARWGKESGILS